MDVTVKRFVFFILGFLIVTACGGERPPDPVLIDFETDADLDRVHWKCHTLMGLSSEHATHGKGSLRLELYPSDYPGFEPLLDQKDWREYRTLCFDVFNPSERRVSITLRIDDRKERPDYRDRYNNPIMLNPGMNRITIPLGTLITTGTGRDLDLGTIERLILFTVSPPRRVLLYLDHLRLVR